MFHSEVQTSWMGYTIQQDVAGAPKGTRKTTNTVTPISRCDAAADTNGFTAACVSTLNQSGHAPNPFYSHGLVIKRQGLTHFWSQLHVVMIGASHLVSGSFFRSDGANSNS